MDERWSMVDGRRSMIGSHQCKGLGKTFLGNKERASTGVTRIPRRRCTQSAKSIEQRYHNVFGQDGGSGGAAG